MPRIGKIQPGDELQGREFKVDAAQLFLYNAALWNAHRIHYDFPYATAVEGYPGLVIAGPLMGDWLAQCVVEWLNGEGELQSLEYQNRRAAFLGEVLYSGGRVVSTNPGRGTVNLELFVRNQKDEVIIPGAASVRFPVA
jgi:3-methylfumaryl-CoA hydratase